MIILNLYIIKFPQFIPVIYVFIKNKTQRFSIKPSRNHNKVSSNL